MTTSQIPIQVRWPYGRGTSSYAISPYTQIHEVPAKPGVYIWLLKPKSQKEFNLATELFEHATLAAEVRGNIRLSYRGDLKKEIRNPDFFGEADGEALFADLFFAIGYPLYIGISQNLKIRLATHKSQFELALKEKVKSHLSGKIPSEFENDSDDESSYFGGRLADAWNSLSTDSLYVKYVLPRRCRACTQEMCDMSCGADVTNQLRKIEYAANSLFNPVFGRR